MKKGLIFDLDGTLWNALVPLCESWNLAMKDNKLPYRFDIKTMTSFMGLTPEETVPLAFKGVDFKTGLSYFEICLHREIEYLAIHPGTLYPHEEEVLADLAKSYPLYIVSNSGKGYVENYLNALHMGKYFSGHLCVGDTNLVKYQNILYFKEKEKLDEVIYIGDTQKDKDESERAGVNFIHANYGFGKIPHELHYIDSLLDLKKEVKAIFKD